jgi:MFS family permease
MTKGMSPRMSLGKNRSKLKLSTANVMLVGNAFIWYLLAFNALKMLLGQIDSSNIDASTPDTLLVFGVNAGAIAISGLLGSFIVDKFKQRRFFLYIWLASGIALSLIPLGLNVTNITDLTIVSLIFGLYFGLGMPATMGFHSSFTDVGGRAKIGGLTFLVICSIFAIAGLIIFNSLLETCLILALVRIIGLVIFHFMSGKEEPYKETSKVKYTSIVTNKSFILYFIPWLMINLVNFMVIPILRGIIPLHNNLPILSASESVVMAIAAVASGFIADKWGRKRLTIIGFIMLGIGYSVLGLFSDSLLGSIIYTVVDGIAWGIFYLLFLFTLWGDLAQNRNSDKFYFLGALPYVTSYFMQLLFTPYLSGILSTTIFSFASVFLFLGVLPLIYAPETLPEKLMKDRDLKSYIATAKKKAQKETVTDKKKEITEPKSEDKNENNSESEEKSDEYKRAQELAEKYY